MSTEYDAAVEIRASVDGVVSELDWLGKFLRDNMPDQRERIVTAAMQGLLAAETADAPFKNVESLVASAIKCADEMIRQLTKTADATSRSIG